MSARVRGKTALVTGAAQRRLGGESAPLGQRGRACVIVLLVGDKIALLIEVFVDLRVNYSSD